MTEHRYPCTAEPPTLLLEAGPIARALIGHTHACKHDATPEPAHDIGRLIEHACTCGITWHNRLSHGWADLTRHRANQTVPARPTHAQPATAKSPSPTAATNGTAKPE